MKGPKQSEFERISVEETQPGLLAEWWSFLRQNKKWWLLPMLIVLAAFGMLMMLSGTAAAPFIYTLF
jgi:drug/metabolite transporter superfamily protein YnfA